MASGVAPLGGPLKQARKGTTTCFKLTRYLSNVSLLCSAFYCCKTFEFWARTAP